MKEVRKQKEFYKQLKDFAKDTSYFDKYEKAVLKKDSVLIELFKYRTSLLKDPKKPTILIPTVDGVTTNKKEFGSKLTNIGKVIKTGGEVFDQMGFKIERGDVLVFPQHKVIGEVPNPDFLALHQYKDTKGDIELKVPPWMKEKIPAIQGHWLKYVFNLPHEFDRPVQNCFTFAVPSIETFYKWEL